MGNLPEDLWDRTLQQCLTSPDRVYAAQNASEDCNGADQTIDSEPRRMQRIRRADHRETVYSRYSRPRRGTSHLTR